MSTEFRPTFDQEQISYRREEKGGHISVLFEETPELNTQLLNPTMKLIIDMCDGSSSMTEIQAKMKGLFPDVSAETIENDVMKALVLMDRYALLTWDPESPFIPETKRVTRSFPGGITVVRALEDDFKKIIALIEACDLVEVTCEKEQQHKRRRKAYFTDAMMANPALFHPVVLRRRIFNFQETFYLAHQDGQIVGCLSVLTEFPAKKCSHVNLILFRDGIDPETYLPPLLETAFFHLEKDELKLKIGLNTAMKNFDQITSILSKASFEEEARLMDEYDFGVHECIYARRICKE
jgi:hypothetical protein